MAKVTLYKTTKRHLNFFVPGTSHSVGFINMRFATDNKEVSEYLKSLIGDPAFAIYVDEAEPEVEFQSFTSASQLHKARKASFGPSNGGLIGQSSLPPGFNQAAAAGVANSNDVRGRVTEGGVQVSETEVRVTSNEAAAVLKASLSGQTAPAPTPTPTVTVPAGTPPVVKK